MADAIDKTRLAPPLMHVFRAAHQAKDAKKFVELRNEAGDRLISGRRRSRHVVTETVLRREVGRDLDSLLNSIALESSMDMTDAPYARKSIINFGLPDIFVGSPTFGHILSAQDPRHIQFGLKLLF